MRVGAVPARELIGFLADLDDRVPPPEFAARFRNLHAVEDDVGHGLQALIPLSPRLAPERAGEDVDRDAVEEFLHLAFAVFLIVFGCVRASRLAPFQGRQFGSFHDGSFFRYCFAGRRAGFRPSARWRRVWIQSAGDARRDGVRGRGDRPAMHRSWRPPA